MTISYNQTKLIRCLYSITLHQHITKILKMKTIRQLNIFGRLLVDSQTVCFNFSLYFFEIFRDLHLLRLITGFHRLNSNSEVLVYRVSQKELLLFELIFWKRVFFFLYLFKTNFF